MSTVLVKGQNMPLTARQVRVTVQVGHAADLSALLVTAAGKVRSDADFIFFNQPNGPGVSCHQPAGGQPWRIDLDLDRVPADIDKVRVVTSLDGGSARFGQFAPPVVRVADQSGAAIAEYTMTGLDTESIVVTVEAYRRSGQWKLRAVGQGYAGGLADLVTDHGVTVDDPGTRAPAQPPQQYRPPAQQPPPVQQQPPQPPGYPPPQPTAPQYTVPTPAPQAPTYQPPPTPPHQQQPPPPYQQPQYQAAPTGQFPAPPPTGQFPTAPPTGQFPAPPPTGQFPVPGQAPAPGQPPADAVAQPGRPVNLAKGQRVSLQKQDGSQLTLVRMGLGWDPIKRRGIFGSREIEVDLDASAVMFADHQPVDIAFFNHLRSNDGSVLHTGDNRTGHGDGDDESIMVELPRVPAHINVIFFVVTSYEGHTFQQVENAFCRLIDESTRSELARYTLSGGVPYTAMVMAKVYRDGGSWKMQAIGEGAQGRTALDLVPHLVRLTY
jgi:stress response protein SCP2